MRIVEQTSWDGRILTATWDDTPEIPAREHVRQASGVVFTEDGKIVLVGSGHNHWSLPGGHPEIGESAEAAFIREVLEEACAVVERCEYLGAQQVTGPDADTPYFQTRWWARARLLPFEPKHETAERILVIPEQFVSTLAWGTSRIAQAILDAALAVDERISRTVRR